MAAAASRLATWNLQGRFRYSSEARSDARLSDRLIDRFIEPVMPAAALSDIRISEEPPLSRVRPLPPASGDISRAHVRARAYRRVRY